MSCWSCCPKRSRGSRRHYQAIGLKNRGTIGGEMDTAQIEDIINDFIEVCRLSKIEISRNEIEVENLNHGNEHKGLKKLPNDKMAVYVFIMDSDGVCLKVGKVYKNSNARYFSQHYNPNSSNSNLATSLLYDNDYNKKIPHGMEDDWIKDNTQRINIIFPVEKEIFTLNLCEAFMQALLKPKYEGFASQR
jgi:hypothetical protein